MPCLYSEKIGTRYTVQLKVGADGVAQLSLYDTMPSRFGDLHSLLPKPLDKTEIGQLRKLLDLTLFDLHAPSNPDDIDDSVSRY